MPDYLSIFRCYRIGADGKLTAHEENGGTQVTYDDVDEPERWADGGNIVIAYQNICWRNLVMVHGEEVVETALSPAGKTDNRCFESDQELGLPESEALSQLIEKALGHDYYPNLNGRVVKDRTAWSKIAQLVRKSAEDPAVMVYDHEDPGLGHVVDEFGIRSAELRPTDKEAWAQIASATGANSAAQLFAALFKGEALPFRKRK